jgi:hypothetical protein
MIVQIGNNPACLTADGKIKKYDPTADRSDLLRFVLSRGPEFVEDLIWSDMPQRRQKSLDTLTKHKGLTSDEFSKLKLADLQDLLFAFVQKEPIDLSLELDKRLDGLIASGRIQFATQADLVASVVPESAMTEEDSRHPKQIALRAEREKQRLALESATLAEFKPLVPKKSKTP